MHGGDIYNNEIEYDFSVNINPFGPYEEVINAARKATSKLTVYPQYESVKLREKIALLHGVNVENVCVTNGASEAINTIIKNRYITDVIIETPSFYGYEKSVHKEQQLYTYTRNSFLKLNENLINRNSVLVIGNPSNPTGEYTDNFIIDSLYKRVKATGSLLLVDESFLALSDYYSNSLIDVIKENPDYYDRLIVVRSFTKTFAIPSVRVGYFISTNERIVNSIMNELPEWNVSCIAQACAMECLNHIDRIKDDVLRIRSLRRKLTNDLKKLGCLVRESHTNYVLFAANSSLYEQLLNRKILIRELSDYRGIDEIKEKLLCNNISSETYYNVSGLSLFRVCVKKEKENAILINAIKEVLEKNN